MSEALSPDEELSRYIQAVPVIREVEGVTLIGVGPYLPCSETKRKELHAAIDNVNHICVEGFANHWKTLKHFCVEKIIRDQVPRITYLDAAIVPYNDPNRRTFTPDLDPELRFLGRAKNYADELFAAGINAYLLDSLASLFSLYFSDVVVRTDKHCTRLGDSYLTAANIDVADEDPVSRGYALHFAHVAHLLSTEPFDRKDFLPGLDSLLFSEKLRPAGIALLCTFDTFFRQLRARTYLKTVKDVKTAVLSYDTAEYVAELLANKNGHPVTWDAMPKTPAVQEALGYLDRIRAPWKDVSSQDKIIKAKAMDKQQTWFPAPVFSPQELMDLKKRDRALNNELNEE